MKKIATSALVFCCFAAGAQASIIQYQSRDIIEITDRGNLQATDHSLDFHFSVDSQTHEMTEFVVQSSLLDGDPVTRDDTLMHIGPEDDVVTVAFHGGAIEKDGLSLDVFVPFADIWLEGKDFGYDEIIYNLDSLSSTVMWIQTSWYEPGFIINGFGLEKVSPVSVPAPATLGLMVLGVGAMALRRRVF
ncbi:MAG: PEP-CTERM sorting domain-containing protein [Oleiphilaceae bacterium]|nr:PEP-CTERM sorting domain-containing protein [Oleiphilaceae bacterium]